MGQGYSDFETGYLTTLLWQAGEICGVDGESTGECYDARFDVDDISESDLSDIRQDLRDFWGRLSAEEWSLHEGHPYYSAAELHGHDFCLSRNGHGAGYFDRGVDPVWQTLQDRASEYGSQTVDTGDDDRLYVGS